MSSQASLFTYFLNAGLVVKTVMLLLIITSIWSWTLILQRAWFFSNKKNQYRQFLQLFTQSTDLTSLYRSLEGTQKLQGLTAIFYVGFKEYLRKYKNDNQIISAIERNMDIQQDKEAMKLSKHLSFFASVGSIAPYVGLFGTVWGIMSSFHALGQAQQATISMVAPGIAEALVATALGLFTAIPAVLAYNHYANYVEKLLEYSKLLQKELVSIVSEHS